MYFNVIKCDGGCLLTAWLIRIGCWCKMLFGGSTVAGVKWRRASWGSRNYKKWTFTEFGLPHFLQSGNLFLFDWMSQACFAWFPNFLQSKTFFNWMSHACFAICFWLQQFLDLCVELLTDPRNTCNVLIIRVLVHALATFANVSTASTKCFMPNRIGRYLGRALNTAC